jgi:hypothetical protein
MSNVTNSLSSIVDNLIRLQRNNSEVLTKLSDVVNSDADTVTLTIEDISNNNIKTVTIPSLGSLKKDIQRLDENIEQLTALNGKDASVRLSDGTFRTIIKSSLRKGADSITSVTSPSSFKSKNNWFFESFLNPFLYVGLDFGTQLNPDTRQAKMQKFILNLDTVNKLNVYNNEIKNNPNLSYADFLDIINANGITYAIDDDILDCPPIEPRYYGNFSVLRVFEENETILIDGVNATKKHLKFQLDKLFYNDKSSSVLETQQLKKGDSVVVNKNNKNTRYYINNVDFETNTISVDLAEGYDSVNIGADILSFYAGENIRPEVRVGVGFNEYLAVFIKPIDPLSNMPADTFSPCIAFYTNELTIKDTDGVVKTLDTYYQESVVDFGAFLFSMAKENIPPVSKGISPESPTLNIDDFKVVQVNKHATDVQSNEDIKALNKEKNSLKTEISELDKAISKKRVEISTKKYKSDIERDTDNNTLKTLIEKRDAVETLYNSTVNDILTKAQDKTTNAEKAKYRIRGFWSLPNSKIGADGSEQAIIQFRIEYRYLTKGGAANNLDQFEYTKEDGTKQKGVYSNWIKINTALRERALDSSTGRYYWVNQDTENGDVVNINQLDIPIIPNEAVEIRIKSVSEAGYPSNPLESEWSETLTIPFPDDLGVSKDILDIIKETGNESAKVALNADLVEKGVYTHVEDQFSQNNTLWKHQSFNIASGFLSSERNVISLFDYLKSLETKIAELEAQINKTVGVLVVKIEDENGNQKIVQNQTKVSIFAGNYKDIVAPLDEPKGVIVTKNYFIRIENDAATAIELSSGLAGSALFGSRFERVDSSSGYYNAPIGLSNPENQDLRTYEGGNNILSNTAYRLPRQSSQVKGQFLYSREKDVTGTVTLYDSASFAEDTWNGTLPLIGTPTKLDYTIVADNFIWNGTSTTSGTIYGYKPSDITFNDNSIYVHAEHPYAQAGNDAINTNTVWLKENTAVTSLARERFQVGTTSNYRQQSAFRIETVGSVEFTNRISFSEDDKYLIGQGSCGCYMFLAPASYTDIRTGGNDFTTTKSVKQGAANGVAFQIQYQFRMTDYFGAGRKGTGRIGGQAGLTQLEYTKMLGFDLFYDEKKFSFDVEVISRYKSTTLGTSDIPTLSYQNTINQTTGNINQVTI